MATIDEVYAQCASIITKVDALQADVDALTTEIESIKSTLNSVDDKVDLLSGDTTSTNVLDKVLGIERRTKAMEFKLLKGR